MSIFFFLSLGSPVLHQTLCRRCVLKNKHISTFQDKHPQLRSHPEQFPARFVRLLQRPSLLLVCSAITTGWAAGLDTFVIHLQPACQKRSGRVFPANRGFADRPIGPAQLIKSAVISAPPEMLYGTIKDALMISYEYSAEWQLISRRRALSAASSMTILSPYDGTLAPLHPQIFLRCEGGRGGERRACAEITCCVCVSRQRGIALPCCCSHHYSVTSYLEEDPGAITTYARIMRNGPITQPELGIHYTAHHL